jgi:hypothetical protein
MPLFKKSAAAAFGAMHQLLPLLLLLVAPKVAVASAHPYVSTAERIMDPVWGPRAAAAAAAFHTAFVFPGGKDVIAATANSTTQAQYWNAAMVLNTLVDSGAAPADIERFYTLCVRVGFGWVG